MWKGWDQFNNCNTWGRSGHKNVVIEVRKGIVWGSSSVCDGSEPPCGQLGRSKHIMLWNHTSGMKNQGPKHKGKPSNQQPGHHIQKWSLQSAVSPSCCTIWQFLHYFTVWVLSFPRNSSAASCATITAVVVDLWNAVERAVERMKILWQMNSCIETCL